MNDDRKTYTMTGGPKGPPIFGLIGEAKRDPLGFTVENALRYGEIIPFQMLGRKLIQVNHPDLVKQVLIENHKNYGKSKSYIRFESAIGKGILTSNGEKWRQDRQKIQPMFKREQIEGYYFNVINEVSEKFKQRWLKLTQDGKAELNITREMSLMTVEIILKIIFGKDNLDEKTIASLHHAYGVLIDYLKVTRLFPKVDLRRAFFTPSSLEFKRELAVVDNIIGKLRKEYQKGSATDRYNMLALLSEAQKQDPQHFGEQDLRDHAATMVFAGFETTSILMQWIWYALDIRPDVEDKLRCEIINNAPCVATYDSSSLSAEQINKMHYLPAVIKETMRIYPPIWVSSREAFADDYFGTYKVERGTIIIVPQLVMHRHPRWWDDPNAFIPERFFPENEAKIDAGLYFPFTHGARKCSGYKLAELEAKIIFSKLLPLFKVRAVNTSANSFEASITLKLTKQLQAEIIRV